MDRAIRGFVAGLGASAVMAALGWLAFGLGIARRTFAGLTYVLLIGHPPVRVIDYVYGQVLPLGFGGVLGIAFIFSRLPDGKQTPSFAQGYHYG